MEKLKLGNKLFGWVWLDLTTVLNNLNQIESILIF